VIIHQMYYSRRSEGSHCAALPVSSYRGFMAGLTIHSKDRGLGVTHLNLGHRAPLEVTLEGLGQ
jgi:hypothetical protein